MWKKSLRTKLIVSFTLISFVAIAVAGASALSGMRITIEQEIQNKLLLLAEAKEGQVFAYLDSLESRTLDFSSDGFIRDSLKTKSISALNEHLIKNKKSLDPSLTDIDVLNKDGVVVASTNNKEIGRNKGGDTCFLEGKKAVATVNPEKGEYPNLSFVPLEIAAPLVDVNTGEFLGVIENIFSTEKLNSILSGEFQIQKGAISSNLGQLKTLAIHLVNKEKNVLAHGHRETMQAVNTIDTFPVQKCLNDREEIVGIYSNHTGVEVIGASMCFPQRGWVLLTEINTHEAFASVRNTTYGLVVMLVLILAFIILDIFLIADNLLKPIKKLHEASDIIAKGNLDYKVSIKTGDEIEQLSAAFNQMTANLKKSHLELQQFSRGLEEKVAEKTKDLQDKVIDLKQTREAVLNVAEDAEREKQETAKEKNKIDAILHSIGDGVFVVDRNLRVILVNKVAAGMAGYPMEEIIGTIYTDKFKFIFEKTGKINDLFVRKAIETKTNQEMSNHTLLLDKSGNKTPVADSAAPLLDDDGRVIGCVVVFHNVTKERNIDRMKTEFISLASHQLRTPLSAMKWFSKMLLQGDAGALNAEQHDFVNNIFESNERMIVLVNSLLNISRIESGRIIIDPKPTDLKELVAKVIKELQNKIAEKKQNLVVSVHSELPKINIDPKLIREVYSNLLTNAIKYTPAGGEIIVFISRKDNELLSQVSDRGYGIAKRDFSRVFQKFYRGDNIVKLETEGTGLGLYMAKAIVESSGGKIWFNSEEGKGTTFWFTLPMQGSPAKGGDVTLDS